MNCPFCNREMDYGAFNLRFICRDCLVGYEEFSPLLKMWVFRRSWVRWEPVPDGCLVIKETE